MKDSSETNLAPIWADAMPLNDYLDWKTRPPLFTRDQNSDNDQASGLVGVITALQLITSGPLRMEEAKKTTSNDLVAGRLSAIGRKENSKRFVALEPSHWIGSEIHWHSSAMTQGRVTYVDIRIVRPEQSDDSESDSESKYRETSDVVKAAIAAYAAQDPDLSTKQEERHRAYREFIRKQGFDPNRQRGFGEKTFEAYEAKFRKKNRGN